MPTYLPPKAFRELARKRALPADVRLQKFLPTSVEEVGDRTLRFTISTAAVDRDDDTIAVEGWDLTNYRANPVVLWGHKADDLPIGRAIEVTVAGDALKATVQFLPADMPCAGELAEAVYRMCREGFLNAASVGFRPLEWDFAEDDARMGVNFRSQELLEFSIVSVPANPEALIEPGQREDARPAEDGIPETVEQENDIGDASRAAADRLCKRLEMRARLAAL